MARKYIQTNKRIKKEEQQMKNSRKKTNNGKEILVERPSTGGEMSRREGKDQEWGKTKYEEDLAEARESRWNEQVGGKTQ